MAWDVLLAAGTVFTLGAISPGPSLMVVLRNTMLGGRRQGVMCALGHGLGFGMYAGLAVFGLIVLLEEALTVFTGLQLIGCALLVWYGCPCGTPTTTPCSARTPVRAHKASLKGSPLLFSIQKSPLFLVAVLAQVLQPDMNLLSKTAVGLLGMTIDALWYLLVAVVLTGTPWLDKLEGQTAFIHRLTALVLWGFAASVLLSL